MYVEGFVLVSLFMEDEPPFHTINGIKMQTRAGSAKFALGGRLSAYDSSGTIGSADDADHKGIVEENGLLGQGFGLGRSPSEQSATSRSPSENSGVTV